MPFKSKEEQRAYHARWYQNNKQKRLDMNYKWRDGKRKVIADAKKVGCSRCVEDHPACLDFHHRDPLTKKFSIGDAILNGCSLERLLDEIEKCELICSNCHRKEHWNQLEDYGREDTRNSRVQSKKKPPFHIRQSYQGNAWKWLVSYEMLAGS